MAMLQNPKHEEYCIYRAQGESKTSAYQKAYPSTKTAKQAGYNLELKEEIKDRIRELREEFLKDLNMDSYYIFKSIKSAIERLEKEASKAKSEQARIQANKVLLDNLMDFAKFLYLIEQKQQNGEIPDTVKEISSKELDDMIKELTKKVK